MTGDMTADSLSSDSLVMDRDDPLSSAPPQKLNSRFITVGILFVVMAISAAYVGAHLTTGWVAADDGILGQGALRVLQGQLPHRDFTEIYTGGLNFVHAGFFRLFGINLLSLRISVFLFFLAWLPAVFYISLRFVSPLAAGAITLLAACWTLPNYPAAMPSWYNLFFATFGAAALLRYLQTHSKRWLFVAGLCGGVSVLIKIIGAYYVAGVLLFLTLLEQQSGPEDLDQRSFLYRVFTGSSLTLFLFTLVSVVGHGLGAHEIYHFVLPSVVIVALILLRERNVHGVGSRERFARLFRDLVPFSAGVLVPILLFSIPYIASGSVHMLIQGVFGSASGRAVALAVVRPVSITNAIYALPLAAGVVLAVYWQGIKRRFVVLSLGLGLSLLALICGMYPFISSTVWYSAATLTPLVVLIGAGIVLIDRNHRVLPQLRHKQILLFLSLAALCSLVQFPFPVPIYFCYAAPLTLFAIVAMVARSSHRDCGYAFAPVLFFYMFFAVQYVVPAYIYELTHIVGKTEVLRLPRAGGIKIEFAPFWEQLILTLQEHSPNGLMYAGNNCPELYFLSGLTNITRDDEGGSPEEVRKAIQSSDLKVVVINETPYFPSARPDPKVELEIARKFPYTIRFGSFLVFWRP